MGVPTQRRTKSSKQQRASHFALKKMQLAKCPKCDQAILPHRVCNFCGFYKGKEVIKIKKKKTVAKK